MHIFQFSELLINGYVEYVCHGSIVRDNNPSTGRTESRRTYVSIEIIVGPNQLAIRQVPQLKAKSIAVPSRGHQLPIGRKSDSMDNSLAGIYRTQNFSTWQIPNDDPTKVLAGGE